MNELSILGITESELDKHCIDLFYQTPIRFKPRKGNKIDEKVNFYIQELDIKFPIEQIHDDLYLIGCERLNIKQNSNTESLLARVGGGYVKFEDHVLKQNKYYQRMLVIYMIKSGESLEWVVEQLVDNKKIHGSLDLSGQYAEKSMYKARSRYSLSPARRSNLAFGSKANRFEMSGSVFGSNTPNNRSSSNIRKNTLLASMNARRISYNL